MAYATVLELREWLRIESTTQTTEQLQLVLDQAAADIDAWCGRSFPAAAASATARVYVARFGDLLTVDPIASTTDLVIATDTAGDGTFDATWASTDYQLEPLNQVASGLTDHAYWTVRAIGTRCFPVARQARVEVTARWGWTTQPSAVKTASLIHAARLHARRQSTSAILEGAAFPTRSAMGMDRDVLALLAPFRRIESFV